MAKVGVKVIEQVFEYISQNPGCRTPDICAALSKGAKAVQRAIHSLDGRIQITGASMARRFSVGAITKPLETTILTMVARENGAATSEIVEVSKYSAVYVLENLKNLEKRGLVQQVKMTNSTRSNRWFVAGKTPKPRVDLTIKQRLFDKKPIGEAIIPAGVRVTRCPGINFDPRYQVPPDTEVVGGWVSMGIGRYL